MRTLSPCFIPSATMRRARGTRSMRPGVVSSNEFGALIRDIRDPRPSMWWFRSWHPPMRAARPGRPKPLALCRRRGTYRHASRSARRASGSVDRSASPAATSQTATRPRGGLPPKPRSPGPSRTARSNRVSLGPKDPIQHCARTRGAGRRRSCQDAVRAWLPGRPGPPRHYPWKTTRHNVFNHKERPHICRYNVRKAH